MCAIVDANVTHEVFGPTPSDAGSRFFDWIQSGKGRLISGGRNLRELEQCSDGYREWVNEAISSGALTIKNEEAIDTRERQLKSSNLLASDDPHVLALAQLSGARLLYSNDKDLQEDFTNSKLIGSPRGKVYTTKKTKALTNVHRQLLGRTDLCRRKPR